MAPSRMFAVRVALLKTAGSPRILYPAVEAALNALGLEKGPWRHASYEKFVDEGAKALLKDLIAWPFDGYAEDGPDEMGDFKVTNTEKDEGFYSVSYEDNPAAYGFSWGRGPIVSDEHPVEFTTVEEVTLNWGAGLNLLDLAAGRLPGRDHFNEALKKISRKGVLDKKYSGGRVPQVVVAAALREHWRSFVPVIRSAWRKGLPTVDTANDDYIPDWDSLKDYVYDDISDSAAPSAPLQELSVESGQSSSRVSDIRLDKPATIRVDVITVVNDLRFETEWEAPEPEYDGE